MSLFIFYKINLRVLQIFFLVLITGCIFAVFNSKEVSAAAILTTEFNKSQKILFEEVKAGENSKDRAGKYIDINLTKQKLSLFEGEKLLNTYAISTGKKSMQTPVGNFAIQNKNPRAWSEKYGLFMPYWMAISPNGEVGIHELPEWPNGRKEGASHLGIPVSHGCVRLGVGPAKRVYNWADIGTPVVIHH